MPVGIISFTADDKKLLIGVFPVMFVVSIILQIVGVSTSEWTCDETSLRCKNIYELDGKVKGLLVSSFTIKCLTCLWPLIYFVYQLRYNRGDSHSCEDCLDRHHNKWRLWAELVTISEILSGTMFVLIYLQHQYISWSVYLYSFLSFLLVTCAGVLTAGRVMWFLTESLESPDDDAESHDNNIWSYDAEIAPPQTALLLDQSQRSSERIINYANRRSNDGTTNYTNRNSNDGSTNYTNRHSGGRIMNYTNRHSSVRTTNYTNPSSSGRQTNYTNPGSSGRTTNYTNPGSSERQTSSTSGEDCPICMETPVNVLLLPCMHTLCSTCATIIQRESSECPFDRRRFTNFISETRR